MQADIQARGFELTNSIRRSIQRAAQADLSRFDDEIVHWKARVFDVNGPRGGADKACRIHVRIKQGPEVVVLDVQDDLYAAIGSAFARMGYALGRHYKSHGRWSRETIRRGAGGLAA